jgi:hypothetical protein
VQLSEWVFSSAGWLAGWLWSFDPVINPVIIDNLPSGS